MFLNEMRDDTVLRFDYKWVQTVLLPRAVVATTLLLSAGVAMVATDATRIVILTGLLGLAGLRILSGNLEFGVMLIVPVSVFVGYRLSAGGSASVGANLILIGVLSVIWLADGILRRRRLLIPRSSPMMLLVLLCLIASLALALGQLPWISFAGQAPLNAQIAGLATFFISAATFMLAATQIRTAARLRWLTWSFLIIAGLVVAASIARETRSIIQGIVAHGATGSLLWAWFAAMGFAQVVGNPGLRKAVKLALAALVVAVFQINFFAGASWVSGWLPALVALVVITWVRAPKLGAALTVASVVTIAGALPNLISNLVQTNEYSLLTRLEAWRIVGEIVQVNPILGLGPANYYWYAPMFPILGFSVNFNSHNNYVDLIAQTGLLGLLAFIGFAVAMLVLARRVLRSTDPGFEQAYVLGVIGGLSGTLVAGMLGDWVIPFVYNVGLDGLRASLLGWLFLGGLVALDQIRASAHQGG